MSICKTYPCQLGDGSEVANISSAFNTARSRFAWLNYKDDCFFSNRRSRGAAQTVERLLWMHAEGMGVFIWGTSHSQKSCCLARLNDLCREADRMHTKTYCCVMKPVKWKWRTKELIKISGWITKCFRALSHDFSLTRQVSFLAWAF